MEKFKITTSVFLVILKTLASLRAEQGGVFLGHRSDYVVRQFIHDKHATTTRATYELNVAYLNPLIKQAYEDHGYQIIGICHTHPPGYDSLSFEDEVYLKSQVKRLRLDKFLTPICYSAKDTEFQFMPFIMDGHGRVTAGELEIVPDDFSVTNEEEDIEDDWKPEPVVQEITTTELSVRPAAVSILNELTSSQGYHTILVSLLWALLLFTISLFPALHRFIVQLLKL